MFGIMANGKRCDRCGKFFMCNSETFDGVKISKMYWDTEEENLFKYYDLCSECAKSFEYWIQGGGLVSAI